ncbi:MAG: aminoacyl-tRNA hydrolase [Lachnospiraceae bacterium]|nr:aminoacyl-tRNA hydrolase [Lachnospiraceae bacterium]MDY5742042.1 aminoacyl-tRNA hydrolase [Lachnospiraceae bacterium]
MKIIVGLGNPTKEYEHTRHNIGFDVIDALAQQHRISVNGLKFMGECGTGSIAGQKVLLLKPVTYMNLSGESIRAACDYYKIDPQEELLVVYDDIHLPPGKLRLRKKGRAGGHNGIKNIIRHLHSEVFCRLKVGVGAQMEQQDLVNHVLGHFSAEEKPVIADGIKRATASIEDWVEAGMEEAMNRIHRHI